METLSKIFPFSFSCAHNGGSKLAVGIIIYLLLIVVGSAGIALITNLIPFLGWLGGIVGGLVDLYGIVGIILLLLVHFDIVKQ